MLEKDEMFTSQELIFILWFLKDVGILEIPAELSARLRSAAGKSQRFEFFLYVKIQIGYKCFGHLPSSVYNSVYT